jgi:hypothetical protein
MNDQARAAARHGNMFRLAAEQTGRLLAVVEGPLTAPAIQWATMPGREFLGCSHLPRTAKPQPLFGALHDVGRLYCLKCVVPMLRTLKPVCHGCGQALDTATLHDRDVVIGLDNFVTLIGLACPDCRALCDPKPEPMKEMN